MLNEIQPLITFLPYDPPWTVIVCPTQDKTQECGRLLTAILPASAKFSGRTAVLQDGRKLSIAWVNDDIFLPESTSFGVSLLGWTAKDDRTGIQKWLTKLSKLTKFL